MQVDKFIANDPGNGDNFGISVAIDGDTALAGAEYDDGTAGTNQGSAYVFVRSGSNWVQQAKLLANDAMANDLFGVSVAVDGDTAIVGAFAADGTGGENQGAAYVFVRSGTTWTLQAKLIADDAGPFDYFGFQVAVRGNTALIGAETGGGAYIFVRSGTSWAQQDKLVPSDTVFQLYAVALGEGTAIIGYPTAPGPVHASQGAAYVFVRNGTNWTEQDKLVASDATGADGGFGKSLGLSGQSAVVGAWGYDGMAGADQGAAYVFVRDGENWTQQAKLTADDGAAQDQLGNSTAIEGNLVLAGAYPADGPAGQNQGAVYRYVRSGTNWTQTNKLFAGDPAPFDSFGYAIGIEGGLAVIGAYSDNEGANDAGAAYIFDVGIPCTSDIDCADLAVCTCDRCINNVCRNTPNEYGNADCVSIVEIGDVTCILAGYNNVSDCPNGDVDPPCTGNDPPFIDIGDVLAILDAYGGFDPCGCVP